MRDYISAYHFTAEDMLELANNIKNAIDFYSNHLDEDGCFHLCFIDERFGFFLGWTRWDDDNDNYIASEGMVLAAGLKDYRSDASMLTDYDYIDNAFAHDTVVDSWYICYGDKPEDIAAWLVKEYYGFIKYANSDEYKVYEVNSDGKEEYLTTEVNSNAKNALKQYIRGMLSSGQWFICKENGEWTARSTYGRNVVVRRA